MSFQESPRKPLTTEQSAARSSPLRYTASNASTNSSAFSDSSNPFPPSRTSTMSSSSSSAYQLFGAGHKRGISETSPTRPTAREDPIHSDTTSAGSYKTARQSLRPLPQAPNASPPAPVLKPYLSHPFSQSSIEPPKYKYDGPAYSSPVITSQPSRPNSLLNRGSSITPMSSTSQRSGQSNHTSPHGPNLTSPDLHTLKNSSTGYLRTLSKFAQNGSSDDFSISSPVPSVAGLSGRRQLKRTDSTRATRSSGAASVTRASAWSESNWMEKQRQFLQAYEYLCHIGEAKEWIEDIIHQALPPIVQLEEALRDGVTLAEIVQAFYPNQPIRIFRHHKLQFRHSDNIALFFRFLGDMELPELFRFELIDLYEKKNIPKVIYCIHALSWLLYRKGLVDFRIGNLVGQLEFEHHELEEMQKGLDKAGISMPSFSGMGASFGAEPEPEPEPLETEDERVARELAQHEILVIDLQSQIRGAVVRMGLGDTMQGLWDSEEMLVDLQSIMRGKWAREIADYRLSMKQFAVDVQSAARGFILRNKERGKEEWWKGREHDIVALQSLLRARKTRLQTAALNTEAKRDVAGIQSLQAAIRGALQRKVFDQQLEEMKESTAPINYLQASIRGALQRKQFGERHNETKAASANVFYLQAAMRGVLQRKRLEEQREETVIAAATVKHLQAHMRGMLQRRELQENQRGFHEAQEEVTRLQAAARSIMTRRRTTEQYEMLQDTLPTWLTLQSMSRGTLCRQRLQALSVKLSQKKQSIVLLQATARGGALRQDLDYLNSSLKRTEVAIVSLQAATRAYVLRRRRAVDFSALEKEALQVTLLQAHIRAWLVRRKYALIYQDLYANILEIVQLQALSRAMLLRTDVSVLLSQLDEEEPLVADLQAAIRGKLVREKFDEKQQYFKANMEKVVKVQSFVRGRLQGEAYKSLTSGTNPPVNTVKGFVHLLNDSNFDFEEETEFERLRKTVVQHVRQNEMADQYITQLDIKIALLVKNKITLDEVVKHQKHFGGDAGRLLTNTEISSKDPFDLKALNKNSRKKLEHYQELFFILQTQSQYLARLFKRIREQATAERECERVKHLVMGLFGYAQKRREEYYLIKVITRSMKEEIENCPSIQDYLRGNFFWAKLFGAYIKSPRDRKYMRDILSPVVKESIVDNSDLDLESDPMQIYLSAIENEQLRTGQRSQRSPDIPREAAIRDPETKRTFITHLQDLRDIADQFFAVLEDKLHKMPFGVRYIAQQMFQSLSSNFQHEEQGYILQLVGHWVWKNYLQPALTEPEKFGVIDRGLSQEQKRNIGEVSKVVGQVAAGRLFGSENVFLQPLNSYVGESIERLGDVWSNCKFPSAESKFNE